MKKMRSILALALAAALSANAAGCGEKPKPYGQEHQLFLPGEHAAVWAVAPTTDLSGQHDVDPLLQSDLVYQELQAVHGLTVIPVNRVAQVYASLRLEKVQSERQASLVCDLLGCDALLVPTVTAYDPYDPPKMGASLQLFRKPSSYARPESIDPHDLARAATPTAGRSVAAAESSVQVTGMFDADNGTVRDEAAAYAAGRHDPAGPYAGREVLISMDRYGAFVYHELIGQLLARPQLQPPTDAAAR